jgi:CheY-like chemotaxis protein
LGRYEQDIDCRRDPNLLEALKYNVRKEGNEVVTAIDGLQALEVARRDKLDLILLDVMLPNLDGFAVCRKVQETSHVPVIMLTGLSEKNIITASGQNAVTGFMPAFATGMVSAPARPADEPVFNPCACQQYRLCDTGNCPVGVTTQKPHLRERLNPDISAKRLEHFLRVSTEELRDFARLTGNRDVHALSLSIPALLPFGDNEVAEICRISKDRCSCSCTNCSSRECKCWNTCSSKGSKVYSYSFECTGYRKSRSWNRNISSSSNYDSSSNKRAGFY